MQTSNQTTEKLNKGFIKTGDLQRQIAAFRAENSEMRPIDAANALLPWFQHPDNESVRFDVLHYAISHTWGTVTAKMEESPSSSARIMASLARKHAAKKSRKAAVTKAVDEAMEQMVATLRHMTFGQARMLSAAAAKLDLSRGSDDQRIGDIFTDDDLRAALKS